jgi:hypothetical protein
MATVYRFGGGFASAGISSCTPGALVVLYERSRRFRNSQIFDTLLTRYGKITK